MGQQGYNAFREQMSRWMVDNSDIYDEFEEMMNSQSDKGVQQIMTQAMILVPEYGRLISKKINRDSADDIADVEALFLENNLTTKIVTQFGKATTVAAMMCCLFHFVLIVTNLIILSNLELFDF